MPHIAHFALVSFIYECVKALYSSLPLKNNTYGSLATLVTSTMYVCICLGVFSLSTVTFSALHPSVNNTVTKDVILFYKKLAPYKISNSYVPPQELIAFENRKEIIVQGANDIKGPWYEYQFLYKPGNVNATPPIIGLYFLFNIFFNQIFIKIILFLAPFKPLLDRQLFFAAHTLPAQNPWLYGVIYRLLNNQKEVLKLINTEKNPFVKRPPKFIKVSLYKYQFSSQSQRLFILFYDKFISIHIIKILK